MKNYKGFILILILILSVGSVNSQTINWESLGEKNSNIINATLGMDYGIVYGLGYGYHINTSLFPIVPNIEYSFPSGNKIFDDFKTKLGVHISWIEFHHFHFSTKIHGVFRRYENDFVRLLNFGSDLAGIVGYYRSKWFVAGEVGFDKAIVTNFKHSQLYKDQYPDVVDGWYEPATGGNFYYGLQAGFSFGKHDIYLRGGKILTQDFKTEPLVPFYGQLGFNIKFP
jgi:hypothetical protein